MSVKDQALHLASSPKVAACVSGATTASGLGTILEWIPDDIGKLATLIGICLSAVLIYSHSLTVREQLRRRRKDEAESVSTSD